MNYRKRKKEYTKLRNLANLVLNSNPLNIRAFIEYNYALKQLEYIKDEKRSKKDAKGKKSSRSFGNEA